MVNSVKFRVTSAVLIAALSLVPLLSVKHASAAGTASLVLTAPQSVQVGGTITANLYVDSGAEKISGVAANLSYNAGQLEFLSITPSGTYPFQFSNSGGNGRVEVHRATTGYTTGNQLVASIQFKAKAGSGTATITQLSDSMVTSFVEVGGKVSQNIITGTASVGIALTSVPPPPGGGGSTGGNTGGTGSTGGTTGSTGGGTQPAPLVTVPATAPSDDKTAPVITGILVSEITPSSAVVSWTTNEPSTSKVAYGIDTNYTGSAADTALTTSHRVFINKGLISGTDIHYMVQSTDAAGNTASSPDQTFKTEQGASVTITVLDSNNKPLKGAIVTVGGVSGETDENGQVTLVGVPLGETSAVIEYMGKKTETVLGVNNVDSDGFAAPVTLTADTPKNNTVLPLFLVIPLVLVLLGLAGKTLIERRRNALHFAGGTAKHYGVISPQQVPIVPQQNGSTTNASKDGPKIVVNPNVAVPPTPVGTTISPQVKQDSDEDSINKV